MERVTLPMARFKSTIDKEDVSLVFDADGKCFVAKKGSIVYEQYTVSFELAKKCNVTNRSESEKLDGGKTYSRVANYG